MGVPTGTVTFMDGNVVLGTVPAVFNILGSNSTARITTSFAVAGGHALTAVHSGDASFVGSGSAALTVQVTSPLSSDETAALANLTTGYQYAYYDYLYGSHSANAYYAYVYGSYAVQLAQAASQTHSATQWYYASLYANAAQSYAYADYAATGNVYAYYAFLYDHEGYVFASAASTDAAR